MEIVGLQVQQHGKIQVGLPAKAKDDAPTERESRKLPSFRRRMAPWRQRYITANLLTFFSTTTRSLINQHTAAWLISLIAFEEEQREIRSARRGTATIRGR
jgi:hypothetical protein